MNRVRIIGGRWRSRLLSFPDAPGLRPTPDRVRETLFNWLGQDLSGFDCLDLFAGSGALGFEALSRGARKVVMVEANSRVFQALRTNAQALGAANLELKRGDGVEFLAHHSGRYHVIFLDPPYRSDLLARTLPRLGPRLHEGGLVYLEAASDFDPGPGWEVWRRGSAGQAHFRLLRACAAAGGADA